MAQFAYCTSSQLKATLHCSIMSGDHNQRDSTMCRTVAALAIGLRNSSPPPVFAPAPPEFLYKVIHCFKEYKKLSYKLSPSDRAMRLVSSNLANYHATVQKLLIRQVLTKPMVRSWRFSWRQCVINKPTTVEFCISPI